MLTLMAVVCAAWLAGCGGKKESGDDLIKMDAKMRGTPPPGFTPQAP